MLKTILGTLGYLPRKEVNESFKKLRKQRDREIDMLKKKITLFEHKEIMTYLVAEVMHNGAWRKNFSETELDFIFSQTRYFTDYYHGITDDLYFYEMRKFMSYLSTEIWDKIFTENFKNPRVEKWLSENNLPLKKSNTKSKNIEKEQIK